MMADSTDGNAEAALVAKGYDQAISDMIEIGDNQSNCENGQRSMLGSLTKRYLISNRQHQTHLRLETTRHIFKIIMNIYNNHSLIKSNHITTKHS